MERLTSVDMSNGNVGFLWPGDVGNLTREALICLAAYEDTGLMPEQVAAVVKERDELRENVEEARGELAQADEDNRAQFVVQESWRQRLVESDTKLAEARAACKEITEALCGEDGLVYFSTNALDRLRRIAEVESGD